MATFNIDAEKAWIASQFISTEQTRYYLCGFLVEPHNDGALLVATDGARLVCIYDTSFQCDIGCESSFGPVIVQLNKQTLAQLKKPMAFALRVTDGRAEVLNERGDVLHIQAENCIIDGTFPEWRKVISSAINPSREQAGYNAKYLGDFAALSGPPTKNSAGFITLEMNGAGPAMVTTRQKDRFGVLMPIASKFFTSGMFVDALIGASESGD